MKKRLFTIFVALLSCNAMSAPVIKSFNVKINNLTSILSNQDLKIEAEGEAYNTGLGDGPKPCSHVRTNNIVSNSNNNFKIPELKLKSCGYFTKFYNYNLYLKFPENSYENLGFINLHESVLKKETTIPTEYTIIQLEEKKINVVVSDGSDIAAWLNHHSLLDATVIISSPKIKTAKIDAQTPYEDRPMKIRPTIFSLAGPLKGDDIVRIKVEIRQYGHTENDGEIIVDAPMNKINEAISNLSTMVVKP